MVAHVRPAHLAKRQDPVDVPSAVGITNGGITVGTGAATATDALAFDTAAGTGTLSAPPLALTTTTPPAPAPTSSSSSSSTSVAPSTVAAASTAKPIAMSTVIGRMYRRLHRCQWASSPSPFFVYRRYSRTLKQKRMYEAQIAQLTQQTFNMESAALATENIRNTMATVDAMQVANKELRKQYGKIDVDKIENIHYDMEDLLEQANEIQETLGRSYAVPDEIDEADLEAELDALALEPEEEEGPSYLADLNKVPDFIDEAPVEESPAKQEAIKTTG
ncbi:hypothetical protein NLJ89_g9560 [Agrocybe chaxingu]|uniref:Charged multivesicular body protein 5 n=1 Tax=Agrocybe chaxingu TaxID=84603 RepID=A0A9W8K0C7_9AGAR|nr:hypothetical protein NLJ89_g9560 [Agrocybe chaxingu]